MRSRSGRPVGRAHRLLLLGFVSACVCCGPRVLIAAAPSHGGEAYHIVYRYELTNGSGRPATGIKVYVPVVKSCPFQEVLHFEITRDPAHRAESVVDQYDQELCRITIPRIEPGQSATVGFACDAVVLADRGVRLDPRRVGGLRDIPPEIRKMYTSNVKHIYDLENPQIRSTAERLAPPRAGLLDRVTAIHDYVAGFKYVRDGRWDAASVVLERRTGSCSEFSYVFCALCRAVGIPTRFVGSTCCRHKRGKPWPAEDTVYHRWAEVFLPPYGWVPFDVTRNRGNPPKRKYFGTCPGKTLILTWNGADSRYLGYQYIGANTRAPGLKRKRTFTWQPLERR